MIKDFYDKLLYRMRRTMAHSIIYQRFSHKKLDWKNPVMYDEKIHWLMAKVYDESYGRYADKLAVRDYVTECGLSDTLIPLIGSGYKNVDDIDWKSLPNKFIIKANHGSNANFYEICSDKASFDIEKAKSKMQKSLKMNKAIYNCQYQYANIKPCLLIESLLEQANGKRLTDYKVVCSYGIPYYILVCNDRDNGRDYYSLNWEYLEFTKKEYRNNHKEPKPDCLKKMLECAAILSKPFPLARVDFYLINGKVYFGEITLTPSAGCHTYLTEIGQRKLGEAIKLPN